MLYIGPRESAALGLPRVDARGPLPPTSPWNALKHIPDVGLFGAVSLDGLSDSPSARTCRTRPSARHRESTMLKNRFASFQLGSGP